VNAVLEQPIIIRQFWRNRSGEAVRIQLQEYEGRVLVDVRVYVTDPQGRLVPTAKGLSCSVRCLPQLAEGFAKALRRAREHGLIKDRAAP
jgi:hypothetical protein